MSTFPWFAEVPSTEPLTQGDIVEDCPAVGFRLGGWEPSSQTTLLDALYAEGGRTLRQVKRALVLTQACDLSNDKVDEVVLCPVQTIDKYREDWEPGFEAANRRKPSGRDWEAECKKLRDGRHFSLALLMDFPSHSDGPLPHLVVHLDRPFVVSTEFISLWAMASTKPRTRLLPPYRESIAQAFARFIMRVAFPVDLTLPG